MNKLPISTILIVCFIISLGVPTFHKVEYTAQEITILPPNNGDDWEKTFGGSANDGCFAIEEMPNGLLVAGWTQSYGAGQYDAWVIKVNNDGDMEWNKTYGGALRERLYSISKVANNGYILGGYSETYSKGFHDMWLIKTDEKGTTIWDKTIGGEDYEALSDIKQTSDNGYIIVGYTNTCSSGNSDLSLIKTDEKGEIIWNLVLGGINCDAGFSVEQTFDGGFIITGDTESYGAGDADVWLVKTDEDGNVLWNKTFGGSLEDGGYSVCQTKDNGYVIAGWTQSFGNGRYDIWLIKTDAQGDMEWERTIGGRYRDRAFMIQRLPNDEFIITGYTETFGEGSADVWLLKIDAEGRILWDRTFGGQLYDIGYDVHHLSGGGYLIGGYTNSFGAGKEDVFLIKSAEPSIGIEMQGGLGVTVAVENKDSMPLYNLSWRIFVDGLTTLSFPKSGRINSISVGGNINFRGNLWGFGPGTLRITIDNISKTVDFYAFGPFIVLDPDKSEGITAKYIKGKDFLSTFTLWKHGVTYHE